jgi:hypothetical protein
LSPDGITYAARVLTRAQGRCASTTICDDRQIHDEGRSRPSVRAHATTSYAMRIESKAGHTSAVAVPT